MAKRTDKKRSKKAAGAKDAQGTRAARLEKALAASLKREAKAASRLEAVQLEVAVLRMALAEVVGERATVPLAVPIPGMEEPLAPKPAAPRPRAPRVAAAAKPAATKPATPRRSTRPGTGAGAQDR